MSRFTAFFLGVLVGAGGLYFAQSFHVLRTNDGLVTIRKTNSTLQDAYVDVRGFTAVDWTERPALSAAVLASDRGDLMQGAVGGAIQQGLDSLLGEPNQP